jgi:hypothetical protein
MGDDSLNEKRIQQVLEIEKKANLIREATIDEAAQLPIQAEKEAQALIEKSRLDAEEEARQLLTKAQAEEECADIMIQTEQKIQRTETLALGNFNHAVAYVIARIIGRE